MADTTRQLAHQIFTALGLGKAETTDIDTIVALLRPHLEPAAPPVDNPSMLRGYEEPDNSPSSSEAPAAQPKGEPQRGKYPIDRPCSACSAGDYKMEYHDHEAPFRKGHGPDVAPAPSETARMVAAKILDLATDREWLVITTQPQQIAIVAEKIEAYAQSRSPLVQCSKCGGTGEVDTSQWGDKCRTCDGTGKVIPLVQGMSREEAERKIAEGASFHISTVHRFLSEPEAHTEIGRLINFAISLLMAHPSPDSQIAEEALRKLHSAGKTITTFQGERRCLVCDEFAAYKPLVHKPRCPIAAIEKQNRGGKADDV